MECKMKQLSTEVAVIGAGPAGMATALTAARLGRKVVIFEKGDHYGGAIGGGKGPLGINTLQQRRLQRVVTEDEAFKYFMDYSHWRANPALVAAYVNKSSDTIHWLEDLGCEFNSLNAYVEGGNHTWHVYDDSEYSICDRIWAKAKELGVKIVYGAAGKDLILRDGRVVGVQIVLNNEMEDVMADAVVIATGGFGNNAEMVAKYTPYELGKTVCAMTRNCDGDGIRMAWDAGASKGYMFYDAFAGLPHPQLGGPGGFCSELRPFRQQIMLFKQQGKRFTDETAMCNGAYGINAIRQQPGTYAYMILTDEILDHYRADGFAIALPSQDPFTGRYEDWPRGFEKKMEEVIREKQSPDLYMGDSIEEIAAQIQIDAETLKTTIEEYNKFCDQGQDQIFHKRRSFLLPIRGKKFYVARLSANSYATLGGININEKAEVIREDGSAIQGLYAAGNDANTICVDSYCFEMPGHTSGFAYNTGRIAGENLNTYIDSCK